MGVPEQHPGVLVAANQGYYWYRQTEFEKPANSFVAYVVEVTPDRLLGGFCLNYPIAHLGAGSGRASDTSGQITTLANSAKSRGAGPSVGARPRFS
jgi:hypothetical protein